MDKLSCGWKNQRSLRTAPDQVKARKPLASVRAAMVRSPPASSTASSGRSRRARSPARCKKCSARSLLVESMRRRDLVRLSWPRGEPGRPECSRLSTPVDKSVCNFLPRRPTKSLRMLDSLWTRLLSALEGRIPETAIESWLRPCRVTAMDGDVIRVAAPNKYSRDWLVQHYTETIQSAARTVLGGNPVVTIEIDRDPERAPAPARERRRGAAVERPVPALHLRVLRHRQLQPVRPGRQPGGGGAAVEGLQPALHLRRGRPRQDAPPARGRPRDRAALSLAPPALPLDRALHQRPDQRDPLRPHRGVPRQVPHHRSAPDRRYPVHLGQGADAGGVLPHLQRSLRGAEADRGLLRLGPQGDPGDRGAPPLPLRVGPDRRHPAARTSRRGWPF